MAQWTREEELAFDIAFGLKKVTIPGFRKALKEEDRPEAASRSGERVTVVSAFHPRESKRPPRETPIAPKSSGDCNPEATSY